MKISFVLIIALTVLTNCFTATAQTKGKNLFPPIDIKTWDKTPCVSGRLATKQETENGTALLFYDKKEDAKPVNIILPKLAYFTNAKGGHGLTASQELVVIIQIVQTENDTMVGYRPLRGGNGASNFRDFRFLSDDEIKKLTGK
jgi:hypothetical protein